MKDIIFLAILSGSCLLWASCATTYGTYKEYHINTRTGYYDTAKKLFPDNILVEEKSDLSKYSSTVLLTFSGDYNDKNVIELTRQFIVALNLSGDVKTKQEMEQFVIKNSLESKVNSIDNPIGLKQLSNEIGPYLVFNFRFIPVSNFNLIHSFLSITDASTNTRIFEIDNWSPDVYNVQNICESLLAPMFNETIKWVRSNRE